MRQSPNKNEIEYIKKNFKELFTSRISYATSPLPPYTSNLFSSIVAV